MSEHVEQMLTPRGVVEVLVDDTTMASVIWERLIAEARKQKMVLSEVPVIVLEDGAEPYFSVAEDDAQERGGA